MQGCQPEFRYSATEVFVLPFNGEDGSVLVIQRYIYVDALSRIFWLTSARLLYYFWVCARGKLGLPHQHWVHRQSGRRPLSGREGH